MPSATTIDELVLALDAIVEQARRESARFGYFAALYARMTRAVRAGIQSGRFASPEKATELDVVFGNRYLAAFDAWKAGEPTPRAWALAFGATERRSPLVIQHLLLGMNAHINLDLGISTALVFPRDGSLAAFRSDFFEINAIIAELTDDVEARIARISPWFGLIDWVGGRTDEAVFHFSVARAREFAWSFAEQLAAQSSDQGARRIEEVDSQVRRLGEMVLKPGPLLRAGALVVRMAETGEVRAVLDALTGEGRDSA